MTALIRLAVVSAAVGLAGTPAVTVPPPPAAGPWRQLGPTATSHPGRRLSFFRIATPYPHRLAVVAVSSSARPIRLHWYGYCEFLSDDDTFEEHAQTISGVHTVVAYPPVFAGATLCYVSVYADAGPGATVSGGVFTS